MLMRCATICLLVGVLVGCSAGRSDPDRAASAPAKAQAGPALEPAPTPGEALARSIGAIANADEQAYRRIAQIRSPEGHSDAAVRWQFAASRLHQAVRDHGVTWGRARAAGFDREDALSPGIPEPPDRKQMAGLLQTVRNMQWTIEGDLAKPADNTPFSGTQGVMEVRRLRGGWVIVLSDPVDSAPREHLRQFARSWNAHAHAIDAATAKVKAAELKTMGQVNDFVEAERKRRLAEQPA
jgi:hypothetical protein